MDIDVSDLVADWGKAYINEDQKLSDIRKAVFDQNRAFGFFKKIPHKSDIVKSVYATPDDILQAFGIEFNPKGGVHFAPWETKMGEFKIDTTVTPDKVREGYLGFLGELDKPERKNWTITKWMIKEMFIARAKEQQNNDVAYGGWKLTGENGTPTVDGATFVREIASLNAVLPANGAMDGIKVQKARMVDAGRSTVISTGALETDAELFYNQINDFVMSIPMKYRKLMDYVWMGEEKTRLYKDGSDIVNNTHYAKEADKTAIKHAPNVRVNWFDGMENSDDVWITPANNREHRVHTGHTGKHDVQDDKRKVHVLSDWKETLFLPFPELVWTNDQENTITAGDITANYS